jgi:UDP-2,4-diacetamido-2,4,6-trideoxy-beta-L-altropyranose hydrolase
VARPVRRERRNRAREQVARRDVGAGLPARARHVAFRCDGDERIGAGHVARCLPLARALEQEGWAASFVGAYGGLAGWLLARAGVDRFPPEAASPCGVPPERYDLAVVDSYTIAPNAICELAQSLPLVTIAEANHCPAIGLMLDYHLDRDGNAGRGSHGIRPAHGTRPELLAGPAFAPLDPALAGVGRSCSQMRRLLVTMGGSDGARALSAEIAQIAQAAFPRAEIVLAGTAQSETNSTGLPRSIALPHPSSLLDVLPQVDMAITAAGLSAYELACAGVPQVAIAIVSNQRRVVEGLRRHDLAPCLDLTAGDSLAELPVVLAHMSDAKLRRRLSRLGMRTFDGRGAARTAAVLTERFARAESAPAVTE